MGLFTIVPVWIIQDVVVLAAAVITLVYIIKREEHPATILLEFVCFIFLYAAVYENFATLMGWYGYGRSLVMVFNVPITVPIFEYLIVYATLRLLESTKIPLWARPFIVGFSGMLADFSLDPVAIKQVFETKEGVFGRWSWFPGQGDVVIYGEPVYNFSGWMLLCGWAAAAILIGRWWLAKSGGKKVVAYLYPALAMLVSLGLIVSPLSNFLLWLEPIFSKGSFSEYIMLGFHLALPIVLLGIFLPRGFTGTLSLRKDFPVFLALIGFHICNIVFGIVGGYTSILWLILLAAAMHAVFVLLIVLAGRRQSEKKEAQTERRD